jgi:restriction system protein
MESTQTRQVRAKIVYRALEAIRDAGGSLPAKDVNAAVEVSTSSIPWAQHKFEKTGNYRWFAILQLQSVACVKAGFLVKKAGTWYLTPEGEKALALGEMGLLDAAFKQYRQWKAAKQNLESEAESDPDDESTDHQPALDDVQSQARESIERYIRGKNPYEFQDLIGALLRGMGYFTPFIAPKGKDGGIDVVAYRDPLGTVSPRIKVQVKHRESSASVQEMRQLMGLLQKDGDVGIFVSSGGFTPDAKDAARGSHAHIELIDLDRLIDMWQEFYPRLSDQDKSVLPLIPVHFLMPES